MTVKQIIKDLSELPEDWEVVYSRPVVFGEKEEEMVAILDIPVIGITLSKDTKEVRFMISSDSMDKESIIDTFGEETVKLL